MSNFKHFQEKLDNFFSPKRKGSNNFNIWLISKNKLHMNWINFKSRQRIIRKGGKMHEKCKKALTNTINF